MRVCIDKIGINGEGVTRLPEGECKDKVCFVSGALPQEVVDIDIVQNKKSYCVAKLNSLIKISKNRVIPKCEYFGLCGGCDIQHMDNHTQLEFKTNKVSETLSKITKKHYDVGVSVRLNNFNYRNKMVFPISTNGSKAIVGMFSSASHNIVDIKTCCLANELILRIFNVSKSFIENSNFTGFNFKTQNGDLKYLVIRSYKDSALVTIVSSKKVDLNDYFKVLSDNFGSIGLSIIVSDNSEDILSGEYYYIDGLKYLNITEFGIKYSIDNRGFMQVNNQIKEQIYSSVLDCLDSSDNVIDCYSGAGLLSAIISKKCRLVVGIEINKSASASAEKLAKENNLINIKFIQGDVKDNLQKAIETFEKCVVILDPPRSGCDSGVLKTILNNKFIYKVIYISCDPATLSRDISILQTDYDVKLVQPYDMFPQTKHIETLVCLQRRV